MSTFKDSFFKNKEFQDLDKGQEIAQESEHELDGVHLNLQSTYGQFDSPSFSYFQAHSIFMDLKIVNHIDALSILRSAAINLDNNSVFTEEFNIHKTSTKLGSMENPLFANLAITVPSLRIDLSDNRINSQFDRSVIISTKINLILGGNWPKVSGLNLSDDHLSLIYVESRYKTEQRIDSYHKRIQKHSYTLFMTVFESLIN
jgi:hypothetical protein